MSRLLMLGVLAFTLLLGPAAFGQEKTAQPYSLREIRAPQGFVEQVVFSPDGKSMAAGAGAVVAIWNVADGKEVQRMQLPDSQTYHRMAFADNGKQLVWIAGNQDPMIRIFDVKTGKQLREFQQPPGSTNRDGKFMTSFLTFSPDGQRMAFSFKGIGSNKGVDVLDVASGKIVLHLEPKFAYPEDMRGCAFSPDGKLIATNSTEGNTRIWDAATGKLRQTLLKTDNKRGGAHAYAAFSPDSKFLATAGHIDKSLDIWNVETGKLVTTLKGKAFFRTAYFSQDNATLVVVPAETSAAALHNLIAEKEIHRFDPPQRLAHFATFSPDNKHVAVVGPSTEGGSSSINGQMSIFLYNLPRQALNPPSALVDEAPLPALWPELSSDNDLRLQLVMKAFRAAPKETVELFAKKLQPVPKERQHALEQSIKALDDDAFTTRDQAMQELQSQALSFAPLLQAHFKKAPAGEVRNRLSFVLKQMGEEKLPASMVIELRALALLEQIGSKDARDLIERLSQGAALARLTVEAQAARARMAKKTKNPAK